MYDDDPFDNVFFKNNEHLFDDPFFKDFEKRHRSVQHGVRVMDVLAPMLSVLALVVLLALCCACCRRTRYSGRVLAPGDTQGNVATTTTTYVHASYPQQPYTAPVSSYPVGQAAPYPTVAPYPVGQAAPYPVGQAAPYPVGQAAPYPVGQAAPYPPQQWGGGMPLPSHSPAPAPAHAPSAPLGDALPPSYEQVVAAEAKPAPYNPNYPH